MEESLPVAATAFTSKMIRNRNATINRSSQIPFINTLDYTGGDHDPLEDKEENVLGMKTDEQRDHQETFLSYLKPNSECNYEDQQQEIVEELTNVTSPSKWIRSYGILASDRQNNNSQNSDDDEEVDEGPEAGPEVADVENSTDQDLRNIFGEQAADLSISDWTEGDDDDNGDDSGEKREMKDDESLDFTDANTFLAADLKDEIKPYYNAAWQKTIDSRISPSLETKYGSPGQFFGSRSHLAQESDEEQLEEILSQQVSSAQSSVSTMSETSSLAIEESQIQLQSRDSQLSVSDQVWKEIDIDLSEDTSEIVAKAVASAMSIGRPRRMALNWTQPIHPSDVANTAIDATLEIEKMKHISNDRKVRAEEIEQQHKITQSAVQRALAIEAMAIADHYRDVMDHGPTRPHLALHDEERQTRVSLTDSTVKIDPTQNQHSNDMRSSTRSSTAANDRPLTKHDLDLECATKTQARHDKAEKYPSSGGSDSYAYTRPSHPFHSQKKLIMNSDGEGMSWQSNANSDGHSKSKMNQSKPLPSPPVNSDHQKQKLSKKTSNFVDTLPIPNDLLQKRRMCSRFLCDLDTIQHEEFWFKNSSATRAIEIHSRILPLCSGCEQFELDPPTISIAPLAKEKFVIHFNAQTIGSFSAILQFFTHQSQNHKSSALDDSTSTSAPFEIIVEAVVRDRTKSRRNQVKKKDSHVMPPTKPKQKPIVVPSSNQIQEVLGHDRDLDLAADIEIHPTFLRFTKNDVMKKGTVSENKSITSVPPNALRVTISRPERRDLEEVHFSIHHNHDHIRFHPPRGTLTSSSRSCTVYIWPVAKPLFTNAESPKDGDWLGHFQVHCRRPRDDRDSTFVRECSIRLDREAAFHLPSLRQLARMQHHIKVIVPTDATTTELTSRPNRRGLYFQSQVVQCGRAPVGETLVTTLKLCNDSLSGEPMTVFLQLPKRPFTIDHACIVISPQCFVYLPIQFSPSHAGTFTTIVHAFSLSSVTKVKVIATAVMKKY